MDSWVMLYSSNFFQANDKKKLLISELLFYYSKFLLGIYRGLSLTHSTWLTYESLPMSLRFTLSEYCKLSSLFLYISSKGTLLSKFKTSLKNLSLILPFYFAEACEVVDIFTYSPFCLFVHEYQFYFRRHKRVLLLKIIYMTVLSACTA